MSTLHELAEAQKAADRAAAEAELPLIEEALSILNSKPVTSAIEKLTALREAIPDTIETHRQVGYVVDVVNNVRGVNLAARLADLQGRVAPPSVEGETV